MNAKLLIRDVLFSLKKLDQQGYYKIADKIFNNVRISQEVEEKVEAKTYDQLLNEMRQYAVSPETLKAGYRSLVFKYHPDRNNSSPIANENLIQLEKVYGRLRASIQSNLKGDNEYLKNLPIKNLNAEILITIFDDGHVDALQMLDQTTIMKEKRKVSQTEGIVCCIF